LDEPVFKPTPVRRPREQVEVQLREAITSSHFKRGERLPSEAELAAEFQVSRSTVREALRALVSEGLISKVPGASGGSFVETVDHQSLETQLSQSMETILKLGSVTFTEVAAVRELLEIPSARLAAANRGDQQLVELEGVIERERGVGVEDPEVTDLDISFHSLVAAAGHNRVLSSFVSALHQATRPVHYLQLGPDAGRETVRQHAEIVAAIAAQDVDGAGTAMAAHLEYLSAITQSARGNGAAPQPS